MGAIEAAVTERLERLEAKRYGETKKTRKSLAETDTTAKSRYVPIAVRRRVCERDGKQCTFVDESGRRCSEREGLEFHHDDPYGLGGDHDPGRMRLLCRRHNVYLAERDYGKSVMGKYRKKDGRVSETAPAYGFIANFARRDPSRFEPQVISRPRVHRFEVNGISETILDEVFDAGPHHLGAVTRLAVSPSSDAVAIVVAEPEK